MRGFLAHCKMPKYFLANISIADVFSWIRGQIYILMGMLLHIRTVRNHTFTLPFHCTNFLGHTFMLCNVQALQVAIAMTYNWPNCSTNCSHHGIGLKLPPHGITVVWDWEWSLHEDTSSHSSDNEDQESTEQKIHTIMHSYSESSHESLSDDEVSLSTQTHTALALDTITIHKTCYSKLANPFQIWKRCQISSNQSPPSSMVQEWLDSKWQRIAYVVHECLEHVHKALSLDWVKYLVVLVLFWTWLLHWRIHVSMIGEWHRDVICYQSTSWSFLIGVCLV